MKLDEVFPYRFYATDTYGWADCPQLAKMVWARLREQHYKITWYGVDFEIITPTSIRLFVYEIADNFRGGIGDRILELEISEFTAAEQAELEKNVLRVYQFKAEEEFARREEAQRAAAVVALRKEMFGV